METKYAEVSPWQNIQKNQMPYGTNNQEIEIKKKGN